MHEASTHTANSFLTLTYDEEHVPDPPSLDRDHVPSFLKRLRRHLQPHPIRYFQCGEYGETGSRPHYHVALFGHAFPDRYKWKKHRGNVLYRSELLEKKWTHGHAMIGDLNFKSAAYIARYLTKKIKLSEYSSEEAIQKFYDRYERVNTSTGELVLVEPEYATMSLRPGIGQAWVHQFWTDIYPSDQLIMNGKPMRPPRYYDRLLQRAYPDLWAEVKKKRISERDVENATAERLRASEMVQEAQSQLYQQRQ